MHAALPIGACVDVLIILYGWSVSPILGLALGASWLLVLSGLVQLARGKAGGRPIVIAGSILFLPVGLVAIWGAAATADRIVEREYFNRGDAP
ncbi:MAG TPA: hypothetical protein VMU50_07130 [Polyangia bacterium]|nr:hypothetical protein [Polyangia bacterium]